MRRSHGSSSGFVVTADHAALLAGRLLVQHLALDVTHVQDLQQEMEETGDVYDLLQVKYKELTKRLFSGHGLTVALKSCQSPKFMFISFFSSSMLH